MPTKLLLIKHLLMPKRESRKLLMKRKELSMKDKKEKENKERIERPEKLLEERLLTNTLWINKKESMRNLREERESKKEEKENLLNKRRTNTPMHWLLTRLLIKELWRRLELEMQFSKLKEPRLWLNLRMTSELPKKHLPELKKLSRKLKLTRRLPTKEERSLRMTLLEKSRRMRWPEKL